MSGYDDGSGVPDGRSGGTVVSEAENETVINGGRDDWGVRVGVKSEPDAALIAEYRSLCPALADDVERLTAEVELQRGLVLHNARIIQRIITERDALAARVTELEEALRDGLAWMERRNQGDPSLDSEEYYATRDYARRVLGGATRPAGGES